MKNHNTGNNHLRKNKWDRRVVLVTSLFIPAF